MSQQNPPRRNVRTRSMWRSATSADTSPLMGGIQRSRRVRGRSDLGATILQAHPTRARRPPPPPAQPRPAYQPLHRPSYPVQQAQIQAPSLLHQFLSGHFVTQFFQVAEINLTDYNNLRLLDRAISQLLPAFSDLGTNPDMAARHLAVSCSNRRLINDGLVTYSQAVQAANGPYIYDAAGLLALRQPNDYLNNTQACTNTPARRPDLRYYFCNGDDHSLFRHYMPPQHTPHPQEKVVCEECVTQDHEATNPYTLCPERIIPMCFRHSELTINGQSQTSWRECTCPTTFSPFRDEVYPTWFCSLCALSRCYSRIQNCSFKHDIRLVNRLPRNHAIARRYPWYNIRRYANDLPPGIPPGIPPSARNTCYLCDRDDNSWEHIIATYPVVDVPGEMEGRKDFRWMVMLCMRCLGHVPDRDISRNRLGYQSSIPDNMS